MGNRPTYADLNHKNKALENEHSEHRLDDVDLADIEQRSRAWLDHSPVCMKIVDLDYNLRYMSRAGVHGLGVDNASELYGKAYPFDFYPQAFKDEMIGSLDKARETGKKVEQEAPVINLLGEEIWFHSSIVPVKDDRGEIEYFLVVSSDTTERKRAETLLASSETRFRAFAESASDWFWETDADGRITWESESSSGGIAGRSFAEINGMTRESIAGNLMVDNEWEPYRQALREHKDITDFEYRYLGQNEHIHYARINGKAVFDNTGTYLGHRGTASDITERKQAEAARHESEARYRQLFESSPIGLWEEDWSSIKVMLDELKKQGVKDWRRYFSRREDQLARAYDMGRPTHINQAALDIYRVPSKQAAMDITKSDLVLPGELADLSMTIIAFIEGRMSHVFESEELTYDGFEIVTRRHAIIPPDDQNTWSRVLYSIEDITERKREAATVRELNARFMAFLDSVPEAMSLKDLDGRYFLVNVEFEKMLGLSSEEIYGKTDPEVMPWDAEIRPVIIAHERAVLESKSAIAQERESALPDGTVQSWIITKFPVLDENGDVIAIGTTNINITERKNLEEEVLRREQVLSEAQRIGHIGHWRLDMRKREFTDWSDEVYRIVGVDRKTFTPTLDNYQALVHEDDLQILIDTRNTALVEKRPYKTENRIVRPNGEVRTITSEARPEFNENGEMTTIFGVTQDITEQRGAEEQLRQAQKLEAVGQLTGGIAHDFNNQLAVILGNLQLFEEEAPKNFESLELLHRAIEATNKSAELTHRLLAFSRKQTLQPRLINVNGLVAGMIAMLQRSLGETIAIETVYCPELWRTLVDPGQLESALLNLAINARDVMPDCGKLTIETANARLDDDYAAAQAEVMPGQYVMLAVTDTGFGMPPEVREHVFEPFFTTKAVGAGSGLGLSMVYGFGKQSGGHVTIYSEEGEGTTIKLYLPRSTETDAVDRMPVTDEVPVARGETVLVVEDNPDLLTLTVTLLGKLGYQVMEAAAGAAALEQLRSTTRVNLLLTDMVLPDGMNGRVLAAEVERRVPGIKVLYMSGYTENAIFHHGHLDANVELLQKPFSRAALAQAMRKVLDGPSD